MTLKTTVRETLRQTGLLRTAYRMRNAVAKKQPPFMTLSPHLLLALNHAFHEARGQKILNRSHYLEFGLYRGFSFWYAQQLAGQLGADDMHFFGFDSFSGLPPIEGRDRDGDFRERQYRAGLEEVKSNLTHHGVDWERTVLIPGFYGDTLPGKTPTLYGVETCSVCVVDCDLYESTRQVLDFVEPSLGRCSYMIFDDWNCYDGDPERGERKAFAEFVEKYDIEATPLALYGGNCQLFFLEK